MLPSCRCQSRSCLDDDAATSSASAPFEHGAFDPIEVSAVV
jgi:hypothetical protein